MKIIAAFIAGLVLATVGTASAFTSFWKKSGTTYACTGWNTDVKCKVRGTSYSVSIFKSGDFGVFYGKHVIFGCSDPYNDPYGDCDDFR